MSINPHELLDRLEEDAAAKNLDEGGQAPLELVRRVVKRVDELGAVFMGSHKGTSSKEHFKQHDIEMKEYVYLMGPSLFGDLKPTPSHEQLGVADLELAIANSRLWRRRADAREAGWLIEAIAMTAYEIEEWLRIWVVSQGGGEDFHPDDRFELGRIISKSEEYNLDVVLIVRLREFNKTRNRAIHRLLRGEISYDNLTAAYDIDKDLPEDIKRWVVNALPNFEDAATEWDALENWRLWDAGQVDFSKLGE